MGENVGKKMGEKVGEKRGEKVGESLGEIDKLNLWPKGGRRFQFSFIQSFVRFVRPSPYIKINSYTFITLDPKNFKRIKTSYKMTKRGSNYRFPLTP